MQRKRKDREMLKISGKKILLEESHIMYNKPFSAVTLSDDWEIATGEWWMEDGWLTGRINKNGGGLIYSKSSYTGDIMLDFYGRSVPPSTHDLNFVWRAEGWDHEKDDAGIGYIAGLNGWWTGKTGIEKYPGCDILATTSAVEFISGTTYHIQAGIVQDMCFIFVDDKLVLEMKDPYPIDPEKYGKVGFGTFFSFIQVRDLQIFRLASAVDRLQYLPEF
jgi:hypothetical protein